MDKAKQYPTQSGPGTSTTSLTPRETGCSLGTTKDPSGQPQSHNRGREGTMSSGKTS